MKLDVAQTTAGQIEDMRERADVLVVIAKAQAQQGTYDHTPVLHFNIEIPELINLIYTYLEHNQPDIARSCVFDLWRATRSCGVLINRLPLITTHHDLV